MPVARVLVPALPRDPLPAVSSSARAPGLHLPPKGQPYPQTADTKPKGPRVLRLSKHLLAPDKPPILMSLEKGVEIWFSFS